MNPLGRASSTLAWAYGLLMVAGLLVERVRNDVDAARQLVIDERNRRVEAEDDAEKARNDLDGALEALHAAQASDEPAPEA